MAHGPKGLRWCMPGAARRQLVGLALLGTLLVSAGFASPRVVPDADPADLVTRQTARVALLFWGLAAAALLRRHRDFARGAWTVGAVTFLIHVVTAFDRVHGWSHRAAYRHVEAVSGFGAGVFISYSFTVVWIVDAAWWWIDRRRYDARPRWLDWLIHAFMAFVVFNATVVYESGFIRWAGVVLFVVLSMLMLARARVRVVAKNSFIP
jgi:cell division protein FtsW (lipid II flippase)